MRAYPDLAADIIVPALLAPIHHPVVLQRPYSQRELDRMTPQDWQRIPPVRVPTADLIPTQECLVIDRLAHLLASGEPEGGDPYGHAVLFDGRLYSHDGHHRWGICWLTGAPTTQVRIVEVTASRIRNQFSAAAR